MSGITLLGLLLFNCTSQWKLKTVTVKAKKWPSPQWGCSVHLHSATVLDVQGHFDEFRIWSSSAFPLNIIQHKIFPAIITEFVNTLNFTKLLLLKDTFQFSFDFLHLPENKKLCISQKNSYLCLIWLNIYFCNFSPYCRNRTAKLHSWHQQLSVQGSQLIFTTML